LEQAPIERGIEVGGQAEGGWIHGIDAGGEVDFLVGIEAGDTAANVLFADAAQVGAELEGMGAAEVGEVIHNLPGADDARIAEAILSAVVHGRGGKGDLVDGFWLSEDGVVAVLADDEFVGHAAGGSEAPVDGEVARAAQGVDEAGSAGEDRLAAVDDVAKAVVAAPGDAPVDGVLRVQNVIELMV
jgi:hypothetical protein